jgi:hypothetical protein
MDWIKGVQEVVPWLTSLPWIPKTIISALIIGVATFVLVLIWTPPPDAAIKTILTDCYRRAIFTRMHAQLDVVAMFASIDKCRESLQQHIPEIKRKDLQGTATELLATMDQMERLNPVQGVDRVNAINRLKLAAVHLFRQLAAATDGTYPLPDNGKLAEGIYFTQQEADAALYMYEISRAWRADLFLFSTRILIRDSQAMRRSKSSTTDMMK